mgnify:FL=1
MAKISRIEPKIPALKERAKVAAYARVSMEMDCIVAMCQNGRYSETILEFVER